MVETALRAQLHTIHPVGAHVSGGIDSSTMALLTQRILQQNASSLRSIHSWSPSPDPSNIPPESEYPRIAAVEHALGLKCHYCDITEDDITAFLARHPLLEPTELTLYESHVCQTAATHGVGVLVSGWGGDEFATSAGRAHFSGCFWDGYWLDLLSSILRHPCGAKRGAFLALREILQVRPPWAGKPRSHHMLERALQARLDWRDYFSAEEFNQAREWLRNRGKNPERTPSCEPTGSTATSPTAWHTGRRNRPPSASSTATPCWTSGLSNAPSPSLCPPSATKGSAVPFPDRHSPAGSPPEFSSKTSFKLETHRGGRLQKLSPPVYEREISQANDSGWSHGSTALRRFRSQRAFISLMLKSSDLSP